MSESSVINRFVRHREYDLGNFMSFDLSERVNLGDGDYFRIRLGVKYNVNTNHVTLVHSLRSHDVQVFPTTNSGKIDLDNVPSDVVSRYDGYQKKSDFKRRLNLRLLRKCRMVRACGGGIPESGGACTNPNPEGIKHGVAKQSLSAIRRVQGACV